MSYEKEYCLIETGHSFKTANGTSSFTRGRYIPYNMLSDFCKECDNYSVFRSAYRYSDNNITSDSVLYGDLYLDFDDASDFNKVRMDAITAISYFKVVYHIVEDSLKIWFSGKKGVHIVVPAKTLGITPHQSLNRVFKYIANSVRSFTPNKTVDTQIYDNKRLFRVPNTIHEESGLYKIPITIKELKELDIANIRNMAVAPRFIYSNDILTVNPFAQQQFNRIINEYYRYNKSNKTNGDRRYARLLDFTPPCVQSILDNGADKGQRNVTIACLAGFYKSSGKSLNETIELISEWNSRNIEPIGDIELKKTTRSIFNGDKLFGCSTLKTISICTPSQCKLCRKGTR